MQKQIRTFEEACAKQGIGTELPDFSMIQEKHRKALESHYKLVIITEAVNDDPNFPDWSNPNQPKYELWPDVFPDKTKPSGFGLSYGDTLCWRTHPNVGSRLCFKSRELAKYTFETFKELYEDYMLIG